MGTACYVVGAGDCLNRLSEILSVKAGDCTDDGKFSLIGTRCIGCCGLAPVVTVNEQVFGKVHKKDMDGLIKPFIALP
jgi:NADH:ubiquinone oxidoreductase subunit E